MSERHAQRLPDAAAANWVDLWAPEALRPWLRLARLDRPVGIWLLLLPCWQGLALAAAHQHRLPNLSLVAAFALGAVLMRSAGCAINDMADHRLDAQVARTARRPVASGDISLVGAGLFALACTLGAAAILAGLNLLSLWVAAASLPLVLAYPFMKRITWWPQIWLGLTFNWGALLGCAAAAAGPGLGHIAARDPAALLSPPDFTAWPSPWADLSLYASGIFWTLGYDTLYAVQDMVDDRIAGVRSSALRLGGRIRTFIIFVYCGSVLFAAVAGGIARLGPLFFAGLMTFTAHLARQACESDAETPAKALALFKSNVTAGLLLTGAIVAGAWGVGA